MARTRARVYTPPPDAAAYRPPAPDDQEGGGRLWLVMAIMAIVLTASGFVLWSFYGGHGEGGAPVIEAQDGAYKERYQGPPVDELATSEIDRALERKGAPSRQQSAAEEPLPEASAPLIAPRSAEAATKAKAPVQAPAKAQRAGGFVVQIAALRAEGGANAAWERLARRDPALFAGASKDIQRADLGEKGVYYRLRAGYFTDRAEAGRFCDRVKTLGQACIVVVR